MDTEADLSPEHERELTRRAAAGDGPAFETLTVRYYRPVGGFLLRRVGLADVVEDLAQETFLEAFRSLRQGRIPERFSTWLFGIAHNISGKWLRRQRILSFSGQPSEEIAALPPFDPEPLPDLFDVPVEPSPGLELDRLMED